MSADPIAMCGNCREVISYFTLTACVGCINDYFETDINEKEGRVITEGNLQSPPSERDFSTHCLRDKPCDELQRIASCARNGHRLLLDPCW